jgi:hypothetical protein
MAGKDNNNMRIDLRGANYIVQWRFEFDKDKVQEFIKSEQERDRKQSKVRFAEPEEFSALTYCTISTPHPTEVDERDRPKLVEYVTGYSACRTSDMMDSHGKPTHFNRREGRKYALEHALRALPKPDRQAVWLEFNRNWPPVTSNWQARARHAERMLAHIDQRLEGITEKLDATFAGQD